MHFLQFYLFHNVASFDLVEILTCFTNTLQNEMRNVKKIKFIKCMCILSYCYTHRKCIKFLHRFHILLISHKSTPLSRFFETDRVYYSWIAKLLIF